MQTHKIPRSDLERLFSTDYLKLNPYIRVFNPPLYKIINPLADYRPTNPLQAPYLGQQQLQLQDQFPVQQGLQYQAVPGGIPYNVAPVGGVGVDDGSNIPQNLLYPPPPAALQISTPPCSYNTYPDPDSVDVK
jgi:hypothetical protein